jgi:hypothetical protein
MNPKHRRAYRKLSSIVRLPLVSDAAVIINNTTAGIHPYVRRQFLKLREQSRADARSSSRRACAAHFGGGLAGALFAAAGTTDKRTSGAPRRTGKPLRRAIRRRRAPSPVRLLGQLSLM